MEKILVRVILIAALLQLGITISDARSCIVQNSAPLIARYSAQVLKVAWKPISIFPGEANRFR